MSADIIVSYDGTANDDDALALGRALGAAGAKLALAYVRHSRELDQRREELAQHDADRRLRTGLQLLARNDVATHVILSASTDGGLEELAEAEGASVIVFGSDYRTAPGRAEPGNTAQRLLDGGKVAVAVAAAGRRLHPDEPIRSIGIATDDADGFVQEDRRRPRGQAWSERGRRRRATGRSDRRRVAAQRARGPNCPRRPGACGAERLARLGARAAEGPDRARLKTSLGT